MIKENHPLRGLCYLFAEAVYHNGGKSAGFRPYRATWRDISHWWLQNKQGEVTDPSADQFTQPFPYQWGKPAGFLTRKPCKRTLKMMEILNEVRR